jgi:hypothetical protein
MLNACYEGEESISIAVVFMHEIAYLVFEVINVHDTDVLAGVGELSDITTKEDCLAGLDGLWMVQN